MLCSLISEGRDELHGPVYMKRDTMSGDEEARSGRKGRINAMSHTLLLKVSFPQPLSPVRLKPPQKLEARR